MSAIALNPALTIAGPCLLITQGKVVYSKDDVPLVIKEEFIDLQSSAYGTVGKAVKSTVLELQVTPIGTIDCLAALIPEHIRAAIPGMLVHKAQDIGAISTVTGVVTKAAHGFREGAMVRLDTFGVLPAGWAKTTLYHLHAPTAGTYTLHATAAAAAAGTAPVIPTTTGTGRHRIIVQESLIVWSLTDGKGRLFHNAAVTTPPEINLTSMATLFSAATFTIFRKFGADPATDANAFWDDITELPAGVDITFDPDAIVMGASTAAWGAVAPWSALALSETGAKFVIAIATTPVVDQVAGITSYRIDSVTATCTARPKNVDDSDVFSKRVLQGAGAGVGRRLAGAAFTATTPDVVFTLNNAVLEESPVGFDGKEDRVRDHKWTATRKFTAGVLDPLFTITEVE